ncbi:MAG: hypothetical protein FD159_2730, partial [Syntrophaceae bacterium]
MGAKLLFYIYKKKGTLMSDIPVFFLHGLAYAGLLFLVSAG